jgi:hypothetical protein
MEVGHTYFIYGRFPDMKRAQMLGDGYMTTKRIHATQFSINDEEKQQKVAQYLAELKQHHPEAEWTYRKIA